MSSNSESLSSPQYTIYLLSIATIIPVGRSLSIIFITRISLSASWRAFFLSRMAFLYTFSGRWDGLARTPRGDVYSKAHFWNLCKPATLLHDVLKLTYCLKSRLRYTTQPFYPLALSAAPVLTILLISYNRPNMAADCAICGQSVGLCSPNTASNVSPVSELFTLYSWIYRNCRKVTSHSKIHKAVSPNLDMWLWCPMHTTYFSTSSSRYVLHALLCYLWFHIATTGALSLRPSALLKAEFYSRSSLL